MLNSNPRIIVCLIIVTFSATATAGLFDRAGGSKSCECAEQCQPHHCAPTIARPCHVNVFNYQRKCCGTTSSCSGCGDQSTCCAPGGCAPCCAAPPSQSCGSVSNCCAPVGCATGAFCDAGGCGQACGSAECFCLHKGECRSQKNCRDIAQLIYESMRACYATKRKDAIHRLGDHYDCCCHPEVMNAFIYALNDSDERVRAKAADEIGDQIRKNRCICGSPVICALSHALADCDRGVRRQAEEALQLSGYRIVDGCCQPSCNAPSSGSEFAVWQGQSTGEQPTAIDNFNLLPSATPDDESDPNSSEDGPTTAPHESEIAPPPPKQASPQPATPTPSAPAEPDAAAPSSPTQPRASGRSPWV